MGGYFCTSTVTTPMAFVLQANISTADVYTTLSDLWIEHDQMTVAWQETDLNDLPPEIRSQYGAIMGLSVTTSTESSTTSQSTQAATGRVTSTIAIATSTTDSASGVPSSGSGFLPESTPTSTYSTDATTTLTGQRTTTGNTASAHTSSPTSTTSSGGTRLSWKAIRTLIAWPVLFWMSY